MSLKRILSMFMDEVWNKGDFSNLESYLAPSYKIINDPGDPWNGHSLNRTEFIERVGYTRKAFPDIYFDLNQMIEEEEKIAVSWTMSGTHKGDLPQIPATGKKFSITGMTFYYFDNNKLCGHIQAFDQLGFLSQIGVLSVDRYTLQADISSKDRRNYEQ